MASNSGFLQISVGKKLVLATTGLILIGFVVVHMVGNLQVFAGQEKLNAYAYMLQNLGPLKWLARIFLLSAFVLHLVTAIRIVLENAKARPIPYQKEATHVASFASKTMRQSGIIIALFLIYHIFHFTVLPDHGIKDALGRHDAFKMVVTGFSVWYVSLIYIIAQTALSLHLSHAFFSIFQTFGLNRPSIEPNIKLASNGLAAILFIGNCSIPVSILLGIVK